MKVLLIRFSSIGDIVLTSPVIRCLKLQVTDVQVHFLTRPRFKMLVESNPYIDKIHLWTEKFGEMSAELKKENFDMVIDLHNSLRSIMLRLMLKKPTITFDKLNYRKWLLVKFKIDKLPRVHLVDRYFISLEKIGLYNDGHGLDYFIPKGEEYDVSLFPVQFRQGYVAFSIGGTYNTKKLPVDKIVSICRKLEFPVILLGGKEEEITGEEITTLSGGNVVNLCGKINLHQSASIIRQSRVVVSHDTGLMHIATAFMKPVVSIWGNTVPAFGMYPYYGDERVERRLSAIAEVEKLYCRPCSKLGYDSCPQEHFRCMRDIDEDFVVENVNNHLK